MNRTDQKPLDTDAADPRTAGPAPEYPQGAIGYPGSDEEMTPRADHGETSYKGLGRLVGKRALITGGDSGIGRAVAIAFAREGADVAISYLPDEQHDADESTRWVEQAGRKALQIPGDLQDERYCDDLVSRVRGELGEPDIIVNNAAFQSTHEDIAELSTVEIERTFRTNVYATLWICRAALPTMAPGGSIINTASIQAFTPSPNLLAYAATKAAIINLSKGLAQLAMKRGVRVNAVAPGPVWTPLIPSTMPESKVRHFGHDTLFGRAAQPVEVAPIFVFLASAEARFVSGEVYGVTGGQTPY
jgi:NAD(P)-dependent dehydrogenase (short-subunit alcohol dehydrogenase family)